MTEKIGLIIYGEGFVNDLKGLLSLDTKVLQSMSDVFNTNDGFVITPEKIEEFSISENINPNELFDSVNLAGYLYNQASNKDVSTDNIIQELITLCKANKIENYEPKLEVLHRLFEPEIQIREMKKRENLETDIVPYLRNHYAKHDIRFSFDTEGKVADLVPTLLISLHLEKDNGEEEIVLFQISEKTCKELKIAFEDYLNKFDEIKSWSREKSGE